ncbi:MAG: Gfo/Idh/MocA family oxidoreductase [Chloroflexi bacterium]|nr:Gfo/Idh/MocA family oxidoreductase [Chloroflexota bacterium]
MSTIHKSRVGVIGVGNMGFHHARNYADIPNAELVAVSDTDPTRATQVAERFHCKAYSNYAEMLQNERLEAVSVVVPTKLHHRVVLETLRAGVHTIVEKPIAANLAQAAAMVSAASASGLTFAVGHIERFNPAVRELKRRIQLGELGTLTSIVTRRVGVVPPRVKDVDVILDMAVHDIDVILFLLGRMPNSVTASASSALNLDRFDHSEIFMRFGDIGCFVQANWITPIKIRTLSVTGSAGHAEVNYVTQQLEVFESHVARQFDDFGDFVVSFGTPSKTTVDLKRQEPLQIELEEFLKAASGGDGKIVTGEDAMNTLAVVDRAKSSMNINYQRPQMETG